MRTTIALAAVVVLGCTACGSSSGVSATAKKGDAFCKLAQVAKADNDALDVVDASDTAKVKLELGAAIDSLTAAVAKAPKDIVDTAKTLLSKEEQLETLLKANGYDFTKALSTDEGKKLGADKEAKQAGDDFKAYLSEKCGIATSDTSPSGSTPSETSPTDTVSGDNSSGTIVDFGEGDAALNKFLDYYEIGTGNKLTSDERSCILDHLSGKVTGAELNQAVAGNSSAALDQALGLAFLDCKVVLQS